MTDNEISNMTENEILHKIVAFNRNDLTLPHGEAMKLERQLAILIMPQLDKSCSEEELLAWGKQFKELVTQKLANLS